MILMFGDELGALAVGVNLCAELYDRRALTRVTLLQLSFRVEDSASTLSTIRHAVLQIKSRGAHSPQYIAELESIENELSDMHRQHQSLFLWHDGPLVEAMRNGDFFLIDEISLADDSVLERLNSVLEPKRLLVRTK